MFRNFKHSKEYLESFNKLGNGHHVL